MSAVPDVHLVAPALTVEPLGEQRYRVSGGSRPHVVILDDLNGPLCDCPDHQYRHRPCKHIGAVRAHLGEPSAAAPDSEPAASVAVMPIGRTDGAPDRPLRHALMSLEELLTLPPPSWRLDGLLPFAGLAVLYGAPGCGKSFLALAWALSLAAGKDWLGRRALYGPAVYIAGEGTRGLSARARAFLDAHELAANDPALEFFVGDGLNCTDAGAVLDFIADSRQVLTGNPAIVVLDTLARVMPGHDENATKDMGLVVAAADHIRRETGALVLIVHHTGKAGELERGSTALRGAADTMLALTNEDGRLTLTVTKQRDAEPGAPLYLRLTPVNGSCIVSPAEGADHAAALGPTSLKVLEGIAVTALDGETSVRQVIELGSVPRASVYRCLKTLEAGAYIQRRGKKLGLTALGDSLVSPRLK